MPVGIADVPALDLDHGDADPGPHDHGVGFPVTGAVGELQVDQHGGAVGQLVPEGAQDQGFRGADPVLLVWHQSGDHVLIVLGNAAYEK